MGARANVEVSYGPKKARVYLYSHWTGANLAVTVQQALARRQRWDDATYLTRIIFSTMIKDSVADETGFGIGPYPDDNSYPYVQVDIPHQKVSIGAQTWTFEEYIAAPEETILDAMENESAPA